MKIELLKLKGLKDLSNKDYLIWRKEQLKAGKINEYTTLKQEDLLYRNLQFVKRHGEQAFKALNRLQRDSYELAALKAHNDNLIRKTVKDWANPFKEDGTVDPNKGVGDANLFYEIMGWDPMSQKELYESNYKKANEAKIEKEKALKKAKEDTDNILFKGSWAGNLFKEHVETSSVQDVDKENNLILDNIRKKVAKDRADKVVTMLPKYVQELNQYNDSLLELQYFQAIVPSITNPGIPLLAAFYDLEDHSILSGEVEDIGRKLKQEWIAKHKLYTDIYGSDVAASMLDTEAKKYIDYKQNKWHELGNKGTEILTIASRSVANNANAIRNLGILIGEVADIYSSPTITVYSDLESKYYEKENVKPVFESISGKYKYIYTDPETKETKEVFPIQTTRSNADLLGIDGDGHRRSKFYDNSYWQDVVTTNSFNTTIHNQSKKLNGYSPNLNVYGLGEEAPLWTEIIPQIGWVAGDMSLNVVPFVGTKVGAAIRGINAATQSTRILGNVLQKTGDFMTKVTPAISSIGMGHEMGMSVYTESLLNNVSSLEKVLYGQATNEYQSAMAQEASSDVNNTLKTQLHNLINSSYEKLYNEWREDFIKNNKIAPELSVSPKELVEILNNIKSVVNLQVANSYINKRVEELKQTDIYKKQLLQIADITTDSYMTMATTNAVKGAFSNYGFKNYLFKNKTQRQMGSMQDALERRTIGSNGKWLISNVYDNVSKGQKLKNLGKAALKQAAGEGFDEALDEIQTFASLAVNEGMLQAYLNNEFNPEGEVQTYNLFHGIHSYLLGAVKGLSEKQTYDAALLGAVSGIGTTVVNPLTVLDPNFKLHWKNAKSTMEKFNLLFTNGVINTYYDDVHGERDAKELIRQANDIIENEDLYKSISKLLTLDLAKLGTNNDDELEALDFMQAVQTIQLLHDFSNDKSNNLLMEVLKDNNTFKTALTQVDKITSGKYTEKEAKDMLTEYYAKNPSVPQSEENSKKALEQITLNATKLKKGVEIVNQVNDKLSSYEKKTGKKVNPLVRALLSERMALDQFLEERVAENEEKISGNRAVNTQRNAASYGTREGVKNKISDLDHAIEYHTDVVDTAKQLHAESKKELDEYLESIKDAEELTSTELKKLAELTTKVKAAELEVRIAETDRNKVVSERNSLILLEESWEDGKVMSKEEILAAHPEDRARMLDPNNISNYSEELQILIQEARNEILRKEGGKEILEKIVPQQRKNVHTFSKNKESLASIMEDPEAALVNMLSSTSHAEVLAALDRHNTQVLDAMIKLMESNPDISPELYDNAVYQTLLNNPSLVSGVLRHKRGTTHTKYGHVVQKAVKAHNILDNVKQYIKNNTEVLGERVELLGTAINILLSVNTEEEFIERLGEITDSPNIAEETKDRLRKLLESLEEVYQHQSKATRATKEQKEKAQKEKEAKKQAEEAERLKREEEIIKKKEEEKKRKEEEKALKEKEIAERRAAGISEEDEKVDNESKLTPEQIALIEEEGEDIELESPTLEELIQADDTGDVDKRETPTNDTSTADAVVDTLQDDTFLGNMLYRYDAKLAAIGIREKRQGRDPRDPMSRRFAWLENEGIKLQEIIDSELHHLVKLGVKLHPLTINPLKNATDDAAFTNDVLWAVEYTDKVKRIHNEKLGGVITANGKLYLIVGIGGYAKNTLQLDKFVKKFVNKLKNKRHKYFLSNPSERFYVDESSHTKVKSISSGRLITRNSSKEQVQDRPVTELLEGDSNPRGNKLDIEDLKWCISHGDEMATVNVAEGEQVRALKNRHPGATYLLVEAADGKLTPASIKPAFLSELRDSALKDELNTAINSLADHNHAERVKAVNLLSEYLYLAKGKDLILVGSPSQPVVKIYRNGTELKSFDLNSPNVRTEMLLFITEEFNPRINIVANKLKNTSYIEKLAEAGALDTDIILLGTCNASYTVYAIDEDGNPEVENIIDSSSPDVGGSDLFDAVATDVFTTTYLGKTAVKDSNGSWKLNGKRVTDYSIISLLEYHEKLAARNLLPIKTTNEEEAYLIDNDAKNPVFYIKRGDHIRKIMGDEAKQLLKLITEEQEEKARLKRIEEAQRLEEAEANGVDIKPENKNKVELSQLQDKPLTDEEIMQQLLGNFESGSEEKSVKLQKAEDTVAKILADSENLELTEDENFYRDTETGELYARVTSIESADVNAKPEDRFDPNNPYATPSTSIGNGVDEFIRDFFDDTLGDVDSLSERYPNATTADLLKLLNLLNTLKLQLNSRGIKIVSKGIKAIGTVVVTDKNGVKKSIKVAGTLDLLGYDSDGNFYVFDVKTNRSMPDPDTKYGKKKLDNWAKQTSLYKEFLEKNYNIKVKALEVIPVKVYYPTPVGASDRQGVGNITYTKDSKESNLLLANGQEYRDAKPYLFPNIPLKETSLDIRYEKLLPHELKIVMDLAESKNTPSAPNTSLSKLGTPIVNDVNNANRSLADLLNDDKLDNAENILYSEYYEEVTALLQQKAEQLGWPYPENTEQYIDLLVLKDIAISNITNVEDWLDMIRDCKH